MKWYTDNRHNDKYWSFEACTECAIVFSKKKTLNNLTVLYLRSSGLTDPISKNFNTAAVHGHYLLTTFFPFVRHVRYIHSPVNRGSTESLPDGFKRTSSPLGTWFYILAALTVHRHSRDILVSIRWKAKHDAPGGMSGQ